MPQQWLTRSRVLPLSILVALILSSTPLLTDNALGSAADPDAPSVLFGLGDAADRARTDRLVTEAPVKMLSSWYYSPDNLSWITDWSDDVVPEAYADGYALHLVVWTGDPEVNLNTEYGPACGRAYPLSSRFLGDMQRLAETFAGSGPLYVTMFTEFQTYPCVDNQWAGAENYYRALKDQYRAAMDVFRRNAPNSRVSLSWGGWQARWDNPGAGQGRSLIPHFADVMNDSDFQSFQAMANGSNVDDIRDMTRILSQYGNGQVMLAHYKPDNGSQHTFDQDTRAMLTDDFLSELTADGLFAWSFMDNTNLSASETTYQHVKERVTRYAAPWLTPDGPATDPPAPEPPDSTPTPVPTDPPTSPDQSLVLYDNQVQNGFVDGSFNFRWRNSCDSSPAVSAPCAYELHLDPWGGLNLMPATALDTSSYTALEWYIHPNERTLSTFSALLLNAGDGGVINQVTLSEAHVQQRLANGFVQVSIPLAVLNPDNQPVNSIQIKNATGTSIPAIHLDEVRLVSR